MLNEELEGNSRAVKQLWLEYFNYLISEVESLDLKIITILLII